MHVPKKNDDVDINVTASQIAFLEETGSALVPSSTSESPLENADFVIAIPEREEGMYVSRGIKI